MVPRSLPLALAAVLLGSCQTVPSPTADAVDTHESMVRWINPASLAVWDVTNNAMDDTGALDGALMDAAAWSKLEASARLLETHSRRLAEAGTLFVGAHNDENEGFATRAEIQALIDADPAGFRALAGEMARHAQDLAAAARARDVHQAGALAETLSERCASCHVRYWEKAAP